MAYQTSDEELIELLGQFGGSSGGLTSAGAPDPKNKSDGVVAPGEKGSALRDLAVGVGSGLVGVAQGFTGLGAYARGVDPEASKDSLYAALGRARDWVQSKGSDVYQQAAQQFQSAIDQGDGFVDSFKRGVGAVAENPYIAYNLLGEALGSIAGVAALARGGGRVLPAFGRLSLPAKASIAEGLITTGATAGKIAEENPDDYLARLWGIPSGLVAGATGYIGGRLAGNLDPDIAMARLLGAGDVPAGSSTGFIKGAIPRAIQGALVEMPQEAIQEGGQQMFTNVGTGDPLMEGVGQSAAAGAIMGAVGGGAMGPLSNIGAKRKDLTKLPKPEPEQNPQSVVDESPTSVPTSTSNKPTALDEGLVELAEFFARRLAGQNSEFASQIQKDILDLMSQKETSVSTLEGVDNLVSVMEHNGEQPSNFFAVMGVWAQPKYRTSAFGRTAAQILETVTGLKITELPSVAKRYTNTNKLDAHIENLTKKLELIKKRVAATGELTENRNIWIRERNKVELQLKHAQNVRDGFAILAEQLAQQKAQEEGGASNLPSLPEEEVRYVWADSSSGRDPNWRVVKGVDVLPPPQPKPNFSQPRQLPPGSWDGDTTGRVFVQPDGSAIPEREAPLYAPDGLVTKLRNVLTEQMDAPYLAKSNLMADDGSGLKPGLTIKDIAKALGISESAVKVDLDNAGLSVEQLLARAGAPSNTASTQVVRNVDPFVSLVASRLTQDLTTGGALGSKLINSKTKQPKAFVTADDLAAALGFAREDINKLLAQRGIGIKEFWRRVLAENQATQPKAQPEAQPEAQPKAQPKAEPKAEPKAKPNQPNQPKAELTQPNQTNQPNQTKAETEQNEVQGFTPEVLKHIAEIRKDLEKNDVDWNGKLSFSTVSKATGIELKTLKSWLSDYGITNIPTLKKALNASLQASPPKSEGLAEPTSVSPEQAEEKGDSRKKLGQAPEKALDTIASAIYKLAGTAPDVVYVENLDSEQVPGEVRKVFSRLTQNGQQVKGLFYQGVVYINPAAHDSELDLMRTYYHEVVGHKGLRAVLGDRLNDVLRKIADARPVELRYYAEKYGLDLSTEAGRLEAAEELVAHQSEALAQDGLLTRLVEMLKAWWADVTGQEMTNAQIMRDLIRPAAGFSVAKRYSSALKDALTVRYRLGTAPDPTVYPEINDPEVAVTFEPDQSMRDSLRSIAKRTKNYLAFTNTLLNKLMRRIPSARLLADAWNKQQVLKDRWDIHHQVVGQLYTKLKPAEADRVSKALLEYSSTGKMAKITKTAKKMEYTKAPDGTLVIKEIPLKAEDVELDDSTYNKLSPKEREVFDAIVEVMAEQLMEQTRLELSKIKDAIDLIQSRQSSIAGEVQEIYEKAIAKIISAHNHSIVATYVPQTRRGNYFVLVKSEELADLMEQYAADDGRDKDLKKEIDELKLSPEHYMYIGAETEAEAASIARHYADKGFITEYKQELENEIEFGVTLAQLNDLFQRIEAAARNGSEQKKIVEGLDSQLRILIKQIADKKDILASTKMQRRQIAGVRPTEIIPNVLEKIRNFGSYYAASKTSGERIRAIQQMRVELRQLTGRDSAEYVSVFNELMTRTDPNQAYEPGGFWNTFANKALGVSSFWYLLSNVSYYALQITQPWLISLPVLNGDFDAVQASSRLAGAYGELTKGGLLQDIKEGVTEVKFDNLGNQRHTELLRQLQARKVLDVGMSQEFGVVGGNVAQNIAAKSLHWLYNAARGVELINRAATAIAAYDLKVKQLTKGRDLDSLPADQREDIHRRAVDYADRIVYSTHGNYSYANAPKVFRNPVGRVLLQFKKIALIQFELLTDLARRGWAKPKLSERVVRLLAHRDLGVNPDILRKIQNNEWLTEAELADLRETVQYGITQGTAAIAMKPADLAFLEQALASELEPDIFITKEKAAASRAAMRWLLGMNAAIAGTLSLPTVPFFGSLVAAILKQMDDDDDDEELKGASAEYMLNKMFGKDVATLLLHGLAGSALDIDISSRVGINFTGQLAGALYQPNSQAQGEDRLKEALYGLAGPTVSLVGSILNGSEALANYGQSGSPRELMRAITALSPLGLRNLLTAQMWDREGLVNTTGLTLIKPEEFSSADITKKMFGFQPMTVSDFWSMRENKERIEREVNKKRILLKRAYFEAYKAGDSERMNEVSGMWKDLQRLERQAKLVPTPKSELLKYVRRKLREEQRVVSGLTTTSRNRGLVKDIAENYGLTSPTGMGLEMERALLQMGVNPYETPT